MRAIVKKYFANDGSGAFTFEMLPRMRRDILDLNRLGVVVWDVRADNYRGGHLVDFSQAHTVPHIELDWNSTVYDRDQIKECCVRDLALFDDMVEEWNEDHPDRKFWSRFLPSIDFGQRLRNRQRYRKAAHHQEGVKFVAAFYDLGRKEAIASPAKALESSRSAGRAEKKHLFRQGGVRKRKPVFVTALRKRKGKPP